MSGEPPAKMAKFADGTSDEDSRGILEEASTSTQYSVEELQCLFDLALLETFPRPTDKFCADILKVMKTDYCTNLIDIVINFLEINCDWYKIIKALSFLSYLIEFGARKVCDCLRSRVEALLHLLNFQTSEEEEGAELKASLVQQRAFEIIVLVGSEKKIYEFKAAEKSKVVPDPKDNPDGEATNNLEDLQEDSQDKKLDSCHEVRFPHLKRLVESLGSLLIDTQTDPVLLAAEVESVEGFFEELADAFKGLKLICLRENRAQETE